MIYWIILFLILISIFFKVKKSEFYLKAAMYLFIIGALLRIVNLVFLAEFIMRVDLILWTISLFMAIQENKYRDEI